MKIVERNPTEMTHVRCHSEAHGIASTVAKLYLSFHEKYVSVVYIFYLYYYQIHIVVIYCILSSISPKALVKFY